MRIYVASAFVDRANAKEWITKLQAHGHIITHDWTGESSGEKTGDELKKYLRKCAQDDVNGVLTCDAIVFLNHDKGRGSHTELGIAIAQSKAIFVLNPEATTNIFFNLPGVMICEGFDDVKWWLDEMERKAHEHRNSAGARPR